MKFTVSVAITCLAFSLAVLNNMEKEEEFGETLRKIANEINEMNTTWEATHYEKFSKLTRNNAKSLLGLKFSDPPAEMPEVVYSEEEILSTPAQFDSREKWPKCLSIKEIRDQSACGSCWAFGAVEAMSDRICIESGQTNQFKVSATDLMSCCFTCGSGCNGGFLYPSWLHWRYSGLVSGDLYGNDKWCQPYPFKPCAHHVKSTHYEPCPSDEYPTPRCHKQCNPSYHISYKKDKVHAKHVYTVSGADHIATEISKYGPIEGSFTVYADFVTYKSGVYQHKTGEMLGGHAIKILGFGEENGVEYWLVANSWNEDWGDNGYFKILRGHDECGIEGSSSAGHADL